VRRVLRLVERTISAAGPHLIVPEGELDGWTTTLPLSVSAQHIIDLYADHGTHEQFQAEFETGLDLTRLPSYQAHHPNRSHGSRKSQSAKVAAGSRTCQTFVHRHSSHQTS